jgi:hypothetical protein
MRQSMRRAGMAAPCSHAQPPAETVGAAGQGRSPRQRPQRAAHLRHRVAPRRAQAHAHHLAAVPEGPVQLRHRQRVLQRPFCQALLPLPLALSAPLLQLGRCHRWPLAVRAAARRLCRRGRGREGDRPGRGRSSGARSSGAQPARIPGADVGWAFAQQRGEGDATRQCRGLL